MEGNMDSYESGNDSLSLLSWNSTENSTTKVLLPEELQNDDSSSISSLSDRQEMILSIIPFFSCLLSTAGSAQIMYMVLSNPKKTPYRRILLGLSCCDVFNSLTFLLKAFLVPAATSYRVWAMGNDATCTFLGWTAQVGISTMMYNGLLSVYFLLTVRYGVTSSRIASQYEP
jgi:hypothetical protein